jgi:hypothetical protein
MPFTISHVAAVLPLLHRRVPLDGTALVIGATSPDLLYVARGSMAGAWGHAPLGLLLWCLPITLLAALAWHRLATWPLLWLAPSRIGARLAPELAPAWPRAGWPIAALSALVGALTHVTWDGVTHSNGWIVRRAPGLDRMIELPVVGELALPRALQHGSTLLGLALLGLWLWGRAWPAPARWPTVDDLAARARRRARWSYVGVVMLAVGLLVAWNVVRAGLGVPSVGDLVVAIMAGMTWGTLGFALAHRRAGAAWRAAVVTAPPTS